MILLPNQENETGIFGGATKTTPGGIHRKITLFVINPDPTNTINFLSNSWLPRNTITTTKHLQFVWIERLHKKMEN